MIQAYIPQIQALNPATTGCTYKTTVWSKLDEQHKNRIRNFENKWVSRAEVTQLYVEYFAGRADALSAFLLTMIWGFEYTGYGSYRTNKYLDSEENQQTHHFGSRSRTKQRYRKSLQRAKENQWLGNKLYIESPVLCYQSQRTERILLNFRYPCGSLPGYAYSSRLCK